MFTSVATPQLLTPSSSKVSELFKIIHVNKNTVFIIATVSELLRFHLLPGPDGQEVLLVTIPEFSSTQTACLVNLSTLQCEPVCFSAFSADEEEESEMNISH